MDNENIHLGLDNADIRDFFSYALLDIFNAEKQASKVLAATLMPLRGFGGLQIQYQRKVAEFLHAKAVMELTKRELAISVLLEEKGWEYFDVSDEVGGAANGDLTRNFIGTENEHDYFLIKIQTGDGE